MAVKETAGANVRAHEPSIIALLGEQGITLDAMLDSALALYVPCEGVDDELQLDDIRERLSELMRYQAGDLNIYCLVLAALYLDKTRADGLLGIEGDPVNILADELIGIAIAEYIAGKKALFNYVRYDMHKPGILAELDVFLDDALAGFIAGCMTRLFEERL